MASQYPKPAAHPTLWTPAIWTTPRSGKPYTRILHYETQDEAEAELAKAQGRGERGYVVAPVKALSGRALPD
jgi:hypothetical protein